MAATASEYGGVIFGPLAVFLGGVWGAQAFMVIVYLVVLHAFTRYSPLDFLKRSGPLYAATAATCSSLASLAVSLDVAEQRMQLPRSVYTFTLPLGAQLNKDGTAIMLAGVLMFTAQAAGARRFDLGNYNYLGVTAARASLDFLLGLAIRRIESYARGLAERLANGMLELGLSVAGGEPGPHLGHIVAVGESGGGRHYTADDPRMNQLHEHLKRNRVRLSIRRGILRFSLQTYNNEGDVDRVLDLTREWLESS